MIRLCFTNLWLKLKTSDGEKKNEVVAVLLVLLL